jgi:hypothetical protein
VKDPEAVLSSVGKRFDSKEKAYEALEKTQAK